MIHPASEKYVALSVVAGGALVQGSVLRFANLNDGTGRMQAFPAAATTDISDTGTFLAYYITPDSEDVEYVGAPGTTTFTLNTGTGISGGTNVIASGTEFTALGGRCLIRLNKDALYGTPAALTAYTPGLALKVHSSGLLCLDAEDDINVVAARVVQNDGKSIVVLLA